MGFLAFIVIKIIYKLHASGLKLVSPPDPGYGYTSSTFLGSFLNFDARQSDSRHVAYM